MKFLTVYSKFTGSICLLRNKTFEQVLQMKNGGDTIPGLDNLLKIVTRKFVKK